MKKTRLGYRERHRPLVSTRCPRCGETLPGHVVRDIWLEQPLDDDWIVAFRVTVRDARPATSEVRVFPNEKRRKQPGEWSAESLGFLAPVPEGGLKTTDLRKVTVDRSLRENLVDVMQRWRKLVETAQVGEVPPEVTPPFMIHGLPSASKRGPHPRRSRRRAAGRSDWEIAWVAKDYVAACHDPSNSRAPAPAVAEKRGLRIAQVHEIVFAARQRGLLSGARQGKSGGELTEDALDLLRQHPDPSGNTPRSPRKKAPA